MIRVAGLPHSRSRNRRSYDTGGDFAKTDSWRGCEYVFVYSRFLAADWSDNLLVERASASAPHGVLPDRASRANNELPG